MKYYYMISMDEFWKLDPSSINIISQRFTKASILVEVTSELTTNIKEFDNIDEMCTFSVQNGFWELFNTGAPFAPYVPEADDPILREKVGP
jgi:hypothetical protein